MGNTSACLSLDGTLSNTLSMTLLIRNRTTPCCKFRPSYPLIPVLKVIKEKKRGKQLIHRRPNAKKAGKKFRLIWNRKILNLTTFCRICRFFFLGL